MRGILIAFVAFLSSPALAQTSTADLKALEATASRYRMMSIECVTDVKIDNKPLSQTPSCIALNQFISIEYNSLKSGLEKAESDAKQQADAKGLQAFGLREKLILILSARSHMQVGGNILKAVSK